MQVARAIGAGILGALIMTTIMLIARLAGIAANIEIMLGSMITGTTGFVAWCVGLGIHLLIGAFFGVVYAAIFEKVIHRSGAAVGSVVGIVHAAVTGFLLAFVPFVHPMIPEVLPAPGAHLSNLGLIGMLAYFGLHMVFGAVVGRVYAPIKFRNRRFAHTI